MMWGVAWGFPETHSSSRVDLAVAVTERRGVESRGDALPARAPRVEPGVAGDTPLHDLPQRRRELPRLFGTDEARQRLLEELVRTETEERGNRVVGLQDLPLKVGNEHRVRRVLDQALGVGSGLVQFPHVAQDADHTDSLTVWVTQRRSVHSRGDDLSARTPRGQASVARDTP